MLPTINFLGIHVRLYGVMAALGFGMALVVTERFARERGVPRTWPTEGAIVAFVTGLIGARAYASFQNGGHVTLSGGGGLVWYGGVMGGAVGCLIWRRVRGVSLGFVLAGAALGLPLAQAIGRIGCQLAGDGDYGTPSDVPWAMGYPDGTVPTPPGVEVHPTPVYETIALGLLFVVLWRWRHRLADGALFGIYLLVAGAERFFIEFVRRNAETVGPLTTAQVISLLAMGIGAGILARISQVNRSLRRPAADTLPRVTSA